MRMHGVVLAVALFVAPSAALAQYQSGAGRWSMVQGALAGGVMFDSGEEEVPPERDDFAFGSLYLGMAFMPSPPPQSFFFGAGIEGTVAGYRGPYQLSIGAGTRVGVAYKWTRYRYQLPDLYLYLKMMPFVGTGSVADEEYLGDEPRVQTTGAGLRLAVGLTAPAWTAFWYGGGAFAGGPAIAIGGGSGGFDEAIICCLAFLVAGLINHTELTYEIYATDSENTEQRIGIRFGVGF